jgi:endonuclease-3 related protein
MYISDRVEGNWLVADAKRKSHTSCGICHPPQRYDDRSKNTAPADSDRGMMNLLSLYETLRAHYGDLRWWPAKTPYEVIVGAVLTQNTAWSNVEKVIAGFGDHLTPQAVAAMDLAALAEAIRSAGFFNQKSLYLKAVTAWFAQYNYDVPTVQREPLAKIRSELLLTKGIGNETADSILLYAFGFPTFVVDAYTMRLCSRMALEVGKSYAAVKVYFEENLPPSVEVYNNFHALIVQNAKEHCRKKPSCGGCPLEDSCKNV